MKDGIYNREHDENIILSCMIDEFRVKSVDSLRQKIRGATKDIF